MPNWCTNRLTVMQSNGDDTLTEFINSITLPEDYEAEYDLSLPHPTPEILVGTRSPKMSREKVEEMRADRDAGKMKAGEKYVGEIHEPTGSWVTDQYLQECLDGIDQNEQAEKETGFASWYDWNIANWSTKWSPDVEDVVVRPMVDAKGHYSDAYGYQAVIRYLTAWCPAENLIKAISKLYPELVFVEAYLEEGMGFWGANAYLNGECRHQYCGGDDEVLDKLHETYGNAEGPEAEDEAWLEVADRWYQLLSRAEKDAVLIGTQDFHFSVGEPEDPILSIA